MTFPLVPVHLVALLGPKAEFVRYRRHHDRAAFIELFNRRVRTECLNRNHGTSLLEARVVIGDFTDDHNRRHRHSALGYLTPPEYAARRTTAAIRWPAASAETSARDLALLPGGRVIGARSVRPTWWPPAV